MKVYFFLIFYNKEAQNIYFILAYDTDNVDNNNIQENKILNPQQRDHKPHQEPQLQHDQEVEPLELEHEGLPL